MIPLRTIALSCLALAPVAVSAGACKPRSTDLTTAASSTLETASTSEALQSTPTDLSTTIASTIETTTEASTIETTSEAAATTSSPPCPSYTQIVPPPSGAPTYKICFKFKGYEEDIPFGEGQNGGSAYYEQGCFACVRDEAPQPPIPS
ncbi:hypothetical protein CEK26_007586 [Fusarium fujikuroi]|nr:hypothetical protein CEK26_007586 [Fusarium fujikuroi]